MSVVVNAFFKPEKHFFLSHFGEIELSLIKILKHLINPELSGSLLQMAALVQLRNETISTRNDLCITSSYIIAEKATAHSILPLSQQQVVQETHMRLLFWWFLNTISNQIRIVFLECIQRQLRHWKKKSALEEFVEKNKSVSIIFCPFFLHIPCQSHS